MPRKTHAPKRPHDPYAALRHPNYRFYAIGSFISIIGDQMLTTAVNWELYERTHSAMALGLWGLIQAIPFFIVALPGGHLADRYNRKMLVLLSEVLLTFCALAFA